MTKDVPAAAMPPLLKVEVSDSTYVCCFVCCCCSHFRAPAYEAPEEVRRVCLPHRAAGQQSSSSSSSAGDVHPVSTDHLPVQGIQDADVALSNSNSSSVAEVINAARSLLTSADAGNKLTDSLSSWLQTETLRGRHRATKGLVDSQRRRDSGCIWVPTIICNNEEGMERPAHPWRGE